MVFFVVLLVALAVAVVVALVVVVRSGRRQRDGVDSFRRQIDALSPQARRGVVDQVQSAGRPGDAEQANGPDGPTSDEDGVRDE